MWGLPTRASLCVARARRWSLAPPSGAAVRQHATLPVAAAAAARRPGGGQGRPARRPRAPSDCTTVSALQQLVSAAGQRQRFAWYAAALSQLARVASRAGGGAGDAEGRPAGQAAPGPAARRLALELAACLQKRTRGADPAELGAAATALARAQQQVPELRPSLQAVLRQLEAAAAAVPAGVRTPLWDGDALLAAARGLTAAAEAGQEPAPAAVAAIAGACRALVLRGGDTQPQDTAAAVCAMAQLGHFDASALDAAAAALCGTPRADGGADSRYTSPGGPPPLPPLSVLEPRLAVTFADGLARLAWPCPAVLRALDGLSREEAWLEGLDPRGLAVLAWAAAMQGVLLEAAAPPGDARCGRGRAASSSADWSAVAQVYARCLHALEAWPGAANSLSTQWAAQLHHARVLLAFGLRGSTLAVGGDSPSARRSALLAQFRKAWEAAQRWKTVSATQRDVWQFLTRDLGVAASLEAPAGGAVAGLTVDVGLSAEAAAQALGATSVELPDRAAASDGAPTALEVDGPSHFASNDAHARLGPTVARDWLLARLGWRVASVRAGEWQQTVGADAGARRRALAECLRRSAAR